MSNRNEIATDLPSNSPIECNSLTVYNNFTIYNVYVQCSNQFNQLLMFHKHNVRFGNG